MKNQHVKKFIRLILDKVRCNNCYGVFDEAITGCPKCKTDAYLMQPFGEAMKDHGRLKKGKKT